MRRLRRQHRLAWPVSRAGVPSFEEALDALRSDQHGLAVARFAARVLADPLDWPSRSNYALALLYAGRLAEAAPMLEAFIQELGSSALDAVGFHFLLGYCKLELGDARGSLLATTTFLDYGNEWNPRYLDGVHNAAAAWQQLGAKLEARLLLKDLGVQRRRPERAGEVRSAYDGPWPRRKIIETSFRILGIKARARRASRCRWLVD